MLGIWRANKTHAMRGRGSAWMFSETMHWIIIRIQICPSKQPLVIIYLFRFLCSCSKTTDAWKRLLTCQAPSSFCIQILRFRNDGKKMDDMVYYKEKLLFPDHHSTPNKGTTVTDVPYQLKAVVVHEGTKIASGHYVCYFKRDGMWYYSSDTKIRPSSALEATSQEAYLLFYDKDEPQEVVEVRYVTDMSAAKENSQHQQTSRQNEEVNLGRPLPIKSSIPPGYYAFHSGAKNPGILKTAVGSTPWQYSQLDDDSIHKAEVVAMAGVSTEKHPRTKGWEPNDVEKLLPVKHKATDGKLSNFVIDYLFLMIEKQSQASRKLVFTVNSDVYNKMSQFSMEMFLKCNYGSLYGNTLTADIILCPVLHGDHWCLVAIELKAKRMVYLDSLFNGVGAPIAFKRFQHFLDCMFAYHNRVEDWEEWEYYIIPSTEISQQSSSVDCGVFVVKWAQHIAEGRPLDFTQEQMVDFRYSLILDVSDGSLSMLSTKPGPPCSHSSTSGVSVMAQSEKKSEKKNKSQLSPSDTDSDFESPKKREKKETSPQESSQTPSSGTRDHTYAKYAANSAQPESVSQSAIPDVAEKILPSGYAYQCHEFKELPTDSFTGAPQNSFYIKVSVGNVTSKDDVDHWLQQFSVSSNMKYNAQAGYKRKGVKVFMHAGTFVSVNGRN